MSDLIERLLSTTKATITSLHEQYALIGMSPDEVTILMANLETQLHATCQAPVEEAKIAVQALQADIQRIQEQIQALYQQLGLTPATEAQPTGSLQSMKAAYQTTMNGLLETKALHLSVLSGDLTKLQQEFYSKLDIPIEEVTEFMEPITETTADLSKKRIKAVEGEIKRMEALLEERTATITGLISEMSAVWSRLGWGEAEVVTRFDTMLFETANNTPSKTLEPTATVIKQLRERKEELIQAENKRRIEIEAKKTIIAALHKKLQSTPDVIKQYEAHCAHLASSPHPLSAAVFGYYSTEAQKLEVMKQAKLQSLVFEVRVKLNGIYKELHMSQSEQSAFKPLQSTVYTDAVLEAHEQELERAQTRLASLQPLFKEIAKWTSMKEEIAVFELSSADPNRFQARNAHLILAAEEKMRKKQKDIFPALENKLIEILEDWQMEHAPEGESSVIKMDGVSVLEQVRASAQAREEKTSTTKKKSTISSSAKVSATPAKTKPVATQQAAATPIRPPTANTTTAAPVTAEKVPATPRPTSAAVATSAVTTAAAPVERVPSTPTPRVFATPLKKSAQAQPTPMTTPLAAVPATPVAEHVAPSTSAASVPPATPVTRQAPPSGLRKPTQFGTTSTLLTSVGRTGAAAAAAATPSRPALGELRSFQNIQTIVEESPKLKNKVQAANAAAAAEQTKENGGESFMTRFQSHFARCANESEQLELFLGPYGLGSTSPKPTAKELSELLTMRSKIYATFQTPEDKQLAEADTIQAHIFLQKSKLEQQKENAGVAAQ